MRTIYVRGEPLVVTLPTGGCVGNDWDSALDAGCDLHCKDPFSWCLECGEVRGGTNPRHWEYNHPALVHSTVGFRPVLTPWDPNAKFPKIMNGQTVRLGFVEGSWDDFRITDKDTGVPADCGVYNGKLIALDNWFTRVSWDSLIEVYNAETPTETQFCFVIIRDFENDVADVDVFSNEQIAHTAMVYEVVAKEKQLKEIGANPVKKASFEEASLYDPIDKAMYRWKLVKKQIF